MLKVGAINVAVLAVAGLVLLAAMEAWLRLTVPASSTESIYAYTLKTARYKVMKPATSITAWGKELRTNDLGFRDQAATIPAKQPGELRIVVLGDSFTVAAGVDFADLYTSRLQEQLRRQLPQAKVINLAVGGYNIVQYALVLQEVALGLQPDLLLVALFPENDFSMDTYDENYAVASGRQAPPQPLAWPASTYVYRAYGSKVLARLQRMFHAPREGSTDDAHRGWNENAKAMKTITRMARQYRIPLEVALLPNTWHFEQQRALFDRVEGLCRELEVSCLNLLDTFIAARVPESSLRLNALDSHPNQRYQAIVADRLAAALGNLHFPSP